MHQNKNKKILKNAKYTKQIHLLTGKKIKTVVIGLI